MATENKRSVTLAQVLEGHQRSKAEISAMEQKTKAEIAAMEQKSKEIAAAAVGNIEDAMLVKPTYTRYSRETSLTGALAGATVGSLLDDTALAALTSIGTDDAGNDQYDFLLNGVKIGTYTKNTELTKVLDDINGGEAAGVNVSYAAEGGRFSFVAKKPGKSYRIEMGEGLADAMFGPPAGSDRSGDSFASVYSMPWLQPGNSTPITAHFDGMDVSFSSKFTTETTIAEVIEKLNVAGGGQHIAFYNKYTGKIDMRAEDGTPVDLVFKNMIGGEVEPDPSQEPPTDYTSGTDAVFMGIEVNGKPVPVSGKKAEITVPTKLSQMNNDSKFQTKDEMDAAINSKLGSTYKAGGSVAFAALPTPDEAHLGFVYNVTDKFTTTADFVEGAGKKNAAGTNVAIVAVTDGETTSYKYDVLGGFVDLSGFETAEQTNAKLAGKVDKAEGMGLSEENFTAAHKAKLDSFEFVSDEEWAAALAEIYGPAESGGGTDTPETPSEPTE